MKFQEKLLPLVTARTKIAATMMTMRIIIMITITIEVVRTIRMKMMAMVPTEMSAGQTGTREDLVEICKKN